MQSFFLVFVLFNYCSTIIIIGLKIFYILHYLCIIENTASMFLYDRNFYFKRYVTYLFQIIRIVVRVSVGHRPYGRWGTIDSANFEMMAIEIFGT